MTDMTDPLKPTITTTRHSLAVYIVDGVRFDSQHDACCAIMKTVDANGYETDLGSMGWFMNGLDRMLIGETTRWEIPQGADEDNADPIIEPANEPTIEPDQTDPNGKRADRGAAALVHYVGEILGEQKSEDDDSFNEELSGLLSDLHHLLSRRYGLTVSGTVDRMTTEMRISADNYKIEVRTKPAFVN